MKFVCIHGPFYQPPRENPWLEYVELQDSASPYHDWNERITAECYAPNATARLLGLSGRIERIVNNYSRLSFNIGPTLLAWMKERAADIHEAIISADRESAARFSGHGSALAQCYNHLIMPLANPRDQRTQVRWAIRDFEFRFGRKPEGCGCRKQPRTIKRWMRWPGKGSNLRSCPLIGRAKCDGAEATNGTMSTAGGLIRAGLNWNGCLRDARSLFSLTIPIWPR